MLRNDGADHKFRHHMFDFFLFLKQQILRASIEQNILTSQHNKAQFCQRHLRSSPRRMFCRVTTLMLTQKRLLNKIYADEF